jgi:biopolymer transport protein ExbD
MGMSSGGGKKGAVQSEINVTPLIDVLLVLLIIFMVVMPIMMKMETIEVPQKLESNQISNKSVNVSIIVKADLSVLFNDGQSKDDQPIQAADVVRLLEPKLKLMAAQAEPGDAHPKVVFVGFDCGVQWKDVIQMMDTIRSLANDQNHDEINVAVKLKPTEEELARQPGTVDSGDRCH